MRAGLRGVLLSICLTFFIATANPQDKPTAKPRARDLGVPFDGTPGPLNAITDISGITVGHTTLISGEGKLQIGKGPVRTGSHGRSSARKRFHEQSRFRRLVVAQRQW